MRIPTWLRPRAARPPLACRAGFRPRLEALEDRVTPSTGGLLDPTFGSGGVVTTSFTNGTDNPYAVVAQPDGKLVVAGSSLASKRSGFFTQFYKVMQVARYNPDGSLDMAFGTGGHVATDFFSSGAEVHALALQGQPDGTSKILAAGYAVNGSASDFALVRYNANGTLDTTFGSGGKVTTNLGSTDEQATSTVIQPDGKVVVAGYTNLSTGVMAVLVRYNANGSLDTSFGNGGKLVTAIKVSYDTDIALQTQPDSSFKLIIAGSTPVVVGSATRYPFFAARFNANGTLDPNFGVGGEVTTLIGLSEQHGGLAVQPDGKVVVAGYDGLPSVGRVVRYTANGSPDASFGPAADGTATLAPPPGYTGATAGGIAVQADGQIVVGGDLVGSGVHRFAMARLNGDHSPSGSAGTLDTGYGTAGWAAALVEYTDAATTRRSQTVALQPDGKAVIVGWATRNASGSPQDFAAVRFLSSAPQIASFTATPNPVAAGGPVALTAGNIADGNAGATVTRVAFYQDSNGDGKLDPATDTLLGYAVQTSPGVWTLTFATTGLAPGTYTLFAQAQDSLGALGDPLAALLQVV